MRISKAIQIAGEALGVAPFTEDIENPDGFPGEAVSIDGGVTVSQDLSDRRIVYRVRAGGRESLCTPDLAAAAAKAVALLAEGAALAAVARELAARAERAA